MTIKLPSLEIYYDFVPKMASTSIKNWLYTLAFGEPFGKNKKKYKLSNIHQVYSKRNFDEKSQQLIMFNKKQRDDLLRELSSEHFYFCVIRDPIKKFISAYSNRVTHHGELSTESIPEEEFTKQQLKTDPDINYFVEHLEDYQTLQSSIFYHTRTITHFLDEQIRYTHVYDISQVNELVKDIKNFIDKNNISVNLNPKVFECLPRYQTGGQKISLDYLNPRSFNKLCEYYAADYEYLEKIIQKYDNLPQIGYDFIRKEYASFL